MKKQFFSSILLLSFIFSLGAMSVGAQQRDTTGTIGTPPQGGTVGTPPSGGTVGTPPQGGTSPTTRSSGCGQTTSTPSAPSSGITIKLENPFRFGDSLQCLFMAIVDNILLPIGGVLAVLAFIYSGFKYVMAQGNETKISEANRALLYSAIGTAILLGAWVISQVISNTIDQLK